MGWWIGVGGGLIGVEAKEPGLEEASCIFLMSISSDVKAVLEVLEREKEIEPNKKSMQ